MASRRVLLANLCLCALLVPARSVSAQTEAAPVQSLIRVFSGAANDPQVQELAAPPGVAGAELKGTHTETDAIDVSGVPTAICLDGQERLMVATTMGDKGNVLVFDDAGHRVATWQLPMPAEALNVSPNGSIFVAGAGRILRVMPNGRAGASADLPHLGDLAELREQVRVQAKQQQELMASRRKQMIDSVQEDIDQVESRLVVARKSLAELTNAQQFDDNDQSEAAQAYRSKIAVLKTRVRTYEVNLKSLENQFALRSRAFRGPDIETLVKAALQRQLKVSAVAATDESVFVAVAARQGYGYAVWRMDHEFSNPQEILTGLRGCCGQMDIQCCHNEVVVAENSRHRVSRYTADGTLVAHFGRRDRTGKDGFSSCCNPMNVTFNSAGALYTAESTTGLIKRYDLDGEQQALVGKANITGGCKNVAIAATSDESRVYMLDLTRRRICVLKPTSNSTAATE